MSMDLFNMEVLNRDILAFTACLSCVEEVFGDDHTLWWSPDSTKLLFAGFDDSAVELYSYPRYGDVDQQYDVIETIPYPKVGR
jgi:hypothetical protein